MDNSLQQYLDLYAGHKDLLKSKSAEGFNSLRDEAYKSLETFGLPKKGSENYEITDLSEMLKPDYGINLARIPLDVNPANSFRCGLPQLSNSLFFLLNDMWGESRDARKNIPEGIEIGPLSSYLSPNNENYHAVKGFYGSLADVTNPIVALNTMLVQEGLFVRVKKGCRFERPLQLINVLENTMPLMAIRRILVILEEDSKLSIVACNHSSTKNIPMASLSVAEMFVGKNAQLDFYDLEESTTNTNRLSSLYLKQDRYSNVTINNFTLHNGKSRNEFFCNFNAPDSDLKLYGFGIVGQTNLVDNYSVIRHENPRCNTDELFKYVVENEGRASFIGRIFVAPGAEKTQALQSNKNIVDSEKALIFSKPQLEIYNDDVKCSHGSATGQLDPMQLFYLRSRGLPEEEAKLLLKQAFMSDVIEGIQLPILKDRIRSIVEKRFEGEDASCDDCNFARCNKIGILE